MKVLLGTALCCLTLGAALPVSAQQADSKAALAAAHIVPGEPATLTFWNRPIVVLRATVRGVTPAERVERAALRIEQLPEHIRPESIQVTPATIGLVTGSAIVAGNSILFGVFPEDVDAEEAAGVRLTCRARCATTTFKMPPLPVTAPPPSCRQRPRLPRRPTCARCARASRCRSSSSPI